MLSERGNMDGGFVNVVDGDGDEEEEDDDDAKGVEETDVAVGEEDGVTCWSLLLMDPEVIGTGGATGSTFKDDSIA